LIDFKYILFLILSTTLFYIQKSGAQDNTYRILQIIDTKADAFTSDNIGNFYLYNKNEILMYDSVGILKNRFSDKSLGNISHVDVRNPLKIVVFFEDLPAIIFLDNMIAQNGETVWLQKMQMEQTSTVCASYNSGLWLYDRLQFQLNRVDQHFKITHQTGNLAQIIGMRLNPQWMMEEGNWLYVYNPSSGILVFDIYGTYLKTIPKKNLINMQVFENNLLLFDGENFIQYNTKTLQEQNIPLPEINSKEIKMVKVNKNKLAVLTKDKLTVYALP
jgi:outer membrane lipoprotein-sorting protein